MTRWLICDMDNTLLDKKPGMYPRFRDSPCFDSLNRWIELGGKLLVVTSDVRFFLSMKSHQIHI